MGLESNIILIDASIFKVVKEYILTDRGNYGIDKRVINTKEFIFIWGTKFGDETMFYAKFQIEEIGRSDYYNEQSISWTNISTNYKIENDLSVADASFNTANSVQANSTAITPTIVVTNIASTITTTHKYKALLFNEKYIQSFRKNQKEVIELEKGWYHSSNVTVISYSLVQLGTKSLPDWVKYDPSSHAVTLDKTPNVSFPEVYEFALEYQEPTGTTTKEFNITVEPCSIDHWNLWVLGDFNKWEEWSKGYMHDEEQKWIKDGSLSQTESSIASGAVAASIAFSIGTSFTSSPSGMFSLINQFQLMILLPMTTYVHPVVVQTINGMDFSMFSF